MILVFIDETTDSKFNDYLGFSIACVNARFYPHLKNSAQKILKSVGWDSTVEFKGSFLFSKSKGCSDVEIEKRIVAANNLLDLNIAKKNSRMYFHFGRLRSTTHKEDYLKTLPSLIYKSLPSPTKGAGKNLAIITCDNRSDISVDELQEKFASAIEEKGFILFERIIQAKSSYDTIGLMYADLVGYLAGRVDNIENDVELFEGLSEEQLENNGKIKKLKTSKELISKIKKLSLYTYNG